MGSSISSKMETIKSVILKAGVPLFATLAGFALGKIATRKPSSSSPAKRAQETDHREILGLKCKIEEFRGRLCRLEERFLHYQGLKEQEIILMELCNKFASEMNRVEFLEREVSLLEAGKQRFDDVVTGFSEMLMSLEFSRSQDRRDLAGKNLLIESKETEVSESKIELEAKSDRIKLMEGEIRELKVQIELLMREKNEISCKLRVAEESAESKEEAEMAIIKNYDQLACELDRLQKDEESEVKETIYLRWRNVCLRHELMMRNDEQERNKETENINFGGIVEIEEFESDNERQNDRCNIGQSDSNLGLTTHNHDHSKRRKLIEKFKRWVDKDKHGKNKCFRRRFGSDDGAEEAYFSARKSCSSA